MKELFISPPGTGKTTACIERFAKNILKTKAGLDSRSYFVLPSREHAERVRYQILKRDIPGLFNAHILTINDMASKLIGFSASSHPTDGMRRLLLNEILDDPESSWEWIGQSAGFRGFRKLLLDNLKEFKEALLTVAEFETLCQPLLKDPAFRAKFRDFSLILKRYEANLHKRGLREAADDIRGLVESPSLTSKLDLVIFDGFYHFTKAQQALITAVASRAGETIVTLTLPSNAKRTSMLFEYPERTRDYLVSIGFKQSKKTVLKNLRSDDPALLHLEQNLFLEKPARFPGTPPASIRVLEASSLRHEVEIIAREIRMLYGKGDLHYSDICIILRSLKGYEKEIDAVFNAYGIPVFIHERQRLIEKGPALALKAFLNLVQEDWKREDLFYFLKSSFLKQVVDEEGVLNLEKLALTKNIRQGKASWLAVLDSTEASGSAKTALAWCVDWEEKLCRSKSSTQAVRHLQALLDILRKGRESGVDPYAVEMEESLEKVIEDSGEFFAEHEKDGFSAERFAGLLKESLETALFSYKPKGRNRVQVYDVIMALPKEYKVVFIAGLLEKSFPQGISEDPIFKDQERKALNRNGIVFEERRWRAGGERYFFYMGVTRAKEKLYLTYPLYDLDGRSALPSFFVAEAQKCFADRLTVAQKSPGDFLPLPSEWAKDSDVSEGLAEILFKPGPEGRRFTGTFESALFGEWLTKNSFKEVLGWGTRQKEAAIQDPTAKKIFREEDPLYSATRLESFATCAFKYFSERTIHLTEPIESREFVEKGNVLHKTLELFYRDLTKKEKGSLDFWRDEDRVRELLTQRLDQVLEDGPFINEPLYRQKVYRDSLRRILSLYVSREKNSFESRQLVPAYFEWNFGGDDKPDAPPLVFKDPSGDIRIQGRIDRIDLSTDGEKAFIIDYKLSPRTGDRALNKKLEKGTELQLPLYIVAVSHFLGREVIGAELRYLKSDDKKPKDGLYRESARDLLGIHANTKTRSEDEWAHLQEEVEARTRAYVARMRSADISVKSKSCEYCPYTSVCRFERWKLIYSEEK